MGEITNLKEVASAPKGCGLKAIQIILAKGPAGVFLQVQKK